MIRVCGEIEFGELDEMTCRSQAPHAPFHRVCRLFVDAVEIIGLARLPLFFFLSRRKEGRRGLAWAVCPKDSARRIDEVWK